MAEEVFYHLDRMGVIDEDTVFNLEFSNLRQGGPSPKFDNHGIFQGVGQDEYDFIEQYFPEGLTSHGKSYLYRQFDLTRDVLQNQDKYLDSNHIGMLLATPRLNQDWVKEIVFEGVRRDEHPKQNSRFQSVFGARNIEELQDWVNSVGVNVGEGDIYKIRTNEHFVADASLLDFPSGFSGTQTELAEILKQQADRYWSGESTETPVYEVLLEPPVNVGEFVERIS